MLAAQEYEGQTIPLAVGTCSLDLVSLSSTVEDAYLLLKIDADAQGKEKAKDGFEMILSTEQIVELQPGGQGGSKYKIQSSEVQGATISLTLPPGSKDEEAFQEIIEQYCGLLRAGDTDRGRVELVDEMGNGEWPLLHRQKPWNRRLTNQHYPSLLFCSHWISRPIHPAIALIREASRRCWSRI